MATITTRSGKGSALTHQEVDANFTGLNTELGQKEVASNKGVANGYASLDAAGRVPSAQLPSYVDDVVEAANLASLPGTGETGKIYVTLDTNKTYRWSGSAYVEISPSPGSTDSLAEGSTNLYFTQARARASVSASGSLSYNSSTGVFSFSDAVTSVAGRTGAVTLTSSDVGLGSVENKSSATIRGELTSGNVTTALGFTPANKAGDTFAGPVLLTQNPVGTTYGNGVSATPTYYLGQGAGDNDAWKIYGESDGTNQVRLVFETNDDNDANEKFLFRYKKTYGDFSATDLLAFDTNGITFKGNSVAHGGNFTGFALSSGQVTTALGYTPYNSSNPSGYLTDAMRYRGSVAQASVDSATLDGFYTQNNPGDSDGLLVFNSGGSLGPFQMRFKYTGLFEFRNKTDSANWNSWKQVLHSANYNSYSPTLTGTGASGTWAISITGTARGVGTSDPALGTGGLWVTTGTGLNVARNNTAYVVLDAGNYSSYALPLTGGNVTVAADTATSFTNSDLGGAHYTNRGNRYLTSNGSNWLADGQDVPLVISGSYSTTTRGRLGLALHNESSTDGAFSPAIVFGSRSNSGSYNSGYAFIMGKKTGANSGVDTNWNSGELHFYAVGSGYIADTPNFTVTNGSSLVNGNTILHAGNYSSYALPLSGGTVTGVLTATGGSKITVQGATDGGSSRGLMLWQDSDTNWGIYMAQSGTGRSLSGASAPASIDGRTAHAVRFRAYGSDALRAFIWENDLNQCVASLTPDTGNFYTRGQMYAGNSTTNLVLHAANYNSYALPLSGGTLTGGLNVGAAIGSRGTAISVSGSSNSSPIALKSGDYATVFGILPHSASWTYLSTGIYYDDGAWVHASADTNNALLGINGGEGVRWYASNNSTGSWNVANLLLWNATGTWVGGLNAATGAQVNGSAILSAANYNSYALPLSGGTMTGAILYSNVAGNKIRFYNLATDPYGIDLLDSELRIYSGAQGSATGGITFGKYDGTTFTEHFRIRNNGGILANGSQILHAANYSSYALPLSGGTISGSLFINSGTSASDFNDLWLGGVNGWSNGESHGINTFYGTVASPTIFTRVDSQFNGTAAVMRWKNFYYSGSQTSTVMTLTATGASTATLNVSGAITQSGSQVLTAGNYSSYALPLSGGAMTGNISGPAYNSPNFIRFASDNNWSYGCSYDGGSQYWMQVQFYGTGDDTRGFRVLDKNGDAVRFRVNGAGNVTASGNVTAYSDERVKANWRQLDDGFVAKLASVKSGIYDRTDIDLTQAGVSAQSLRNVLPQTVMESSDGELSVAYGNAALVSAVELAKELVALKHKVAELEARVH